MPFALNSLDGTRIYYEDDGGNGPAVLFYYGFMDPIPAARALGLARALGETCRLVFVDHRGQGKSDKPHDVAAYSLALRVADFLAVLDDLHLPKAHFVGVSWGARLGFALGELAPDRLESLTLIANQPYAWDQSWPLVQAVSSGLNAGKVGGMPAVLEWYEAYADQPLYEPYRSWLLDNDFAALDAAWNAALAEGSVSKNLKLWITPCLIATGDRDDMYANAQAAAHNIPDATFISLEGMSHLASVEEVDQILREVLALFRFATN